MKEIRLLQANEIDVRVQQIKQDLTGASFLLYKDARVDMTILDETFGAMNWQRRHTRDNANCIISVWDEEKKCWVEKEDTGTESNTEKEKGLASDSFKRAGTNWGIGRELYTAPFIWISLTKDDFNSSNKLKTKFCVSEITYEDRTIKSVVIVDEKGTVRYGKPGTKSKPSEKKSEPKGEKKEEPIPMEQAVDPKRKATQMELDVLYELCKKYNVMPSNVAAAYKLNYIDEATYEIVQDAIKKLDKKYGAKKNA